MFIYEKIIVIGLFWIASDCDGLTCPEVCVRMAVLNKKLKDAEAIYLEQNDLDKALEMYQKLHKWDEGRNLYYILDNIM